MKPEFEIYRRPKYYYLYRENALIWMVAIGGLIWWVASLCPSGQYSIMQGIGQFLVFGGVFLGVINTFTGLMQYDLFTTKPLELLKFNKDSVEVGGKSYPIDIVENMEINCFDYKDMYNYPTGFAYIRSSGNSNYIKFRLSSGKEEKIRFVQEYENEIAKARIELVEYYRVGILHYYNLLECLGITDYEEIQSFKKSLPSVENKIHHRP